jgi:hypothetical protein
LWILDGGRGARHSRTHYLDALARSGSLCGMPLDAVLACQRAGILAWRRQPPPIQPEFGHAMQTVLAMRRAGVDLDAVANELQAAHAFAAGSGVVRGY